MQESSNKSEDNFIDFGAIMTDGRLTEPSDGKLYRLKDAIEYSKKLGRPLSNTEMEKFVIDTESDEKQEALKILFQKIREAEVQAEKPDEADCFHHLTCYLPEYKIEDVYGFTENEVKRICARIKEVESWIQKQC